MFGKQDVQKFLFESFSSGSYNRAESFKKIIKIHISMVLTGKKFYF